MSREAKAEKDFFRLNGGLNTEINELTFPDGYTRDEANYELLLDGSRRRRKGLAVESGAGSALTVPAFVSGVKSQGYVWKNVGGDPNLQLVVYRKGSTLFFAEADETISDSWYIGTGATVSMVDFETTGATTANTDNASVTFTQGRGYLFVGGPYIKTFYVAFDPDAGTFSATGVNVLIRDFGDVEDGVTMAQEPTGTITESHRYNLRNRGWNETDMATYDSALSKHPAKNAIWHRGYKRTYDGATSSALINPVDGTRSFDATKMDAEPFGSSSAPRGSLFIEPYDTSFGYGISGAGSVQAITTWTHVDSGLYWTLTITTAASHGLSSGEQFTIEGNTMKYLTDPGGIGPTSVTRSLDGTWTAQAGTTGSTIVVYWSAEPSNFDSWVDQYLTLGNVDTSLSITRDTGEDHGDAFDAIEYYAGRLFYGGMNNQEFADTIIFSQIADQPSKFGKCYQEQDPTDEYFNSLLSNDGGTLVIPGLGGVINLIAVRNSLIVLAREGVWEISGGQRGAFTADGYSVRKLSDIGASSPDGWAKLEGSLVYSGPNGISVIAPNQYTGQLEVQSASNGTIQTLWNQLADDQQESVSMAYDDAQRRLYILIGSAADTTAIDTMLLFEAGAGAWFKYTFDTPADNSLLCGFAIPTVDDSTDNKKMKFIYQASTTTIQVADFAQTTFDDWHGANGPLPYLVFGHDSMGGMSGRGQAPVITVFSKRTETGYTDTGGGFDPINESSTLLTPYWDWTDDAISNKIGTPQQTYRHTRNFVPASTDDVNGYPVVVTRNKIRGRGRSLQLRFDGAEDKDSHILGYTLNYKIPRRA